MGILTLTQWGSSQGRPHATTSWRQVLKSTLTRSWPNTIERITVCVRCRVFTNYTSPRDTLVVKNALKGACKRKWTTIKTAAAAKDMSHWSRRWFRVQVHSSHEHRRGTKRPHTTSDETAWITIWSASKHNAITIKPNASPPRIPIKISDRQNHSFLLPFSLTHSSSTEVLAYRLIGTCA